MDIDLKLPRDFLEEEPREIRVSSDVKKIWAVELDLLVKFDEVCRRNGIQYFIDGGTLLGAVRHNGFIPWDDDIDVCMFRKEYEKLEAIADKEFKEPYFWQTFKTDLHSARGHGALRNSRTTAISKSDLVNGRTIRKFNQGICLDVFPLDNIPDSEKEAADFLNGVQKRIEKIWFINSFVAEFKMRGWRVLTSVRGIQKALRYVGYVLLARLHGKNVLREAAVDHEAWCAKYDSVETNRSCTIAHWPIRKDRQYYRRGWFDASVMLDFEMLKLPAPSGYRELLDGLYGDWHKHVIGSTLHSGVFFDVEKSYREYMG